MPNFSPLPAYILGSACVGRGLMALTYPRQEYGHIGLPLRATTSKIDADLSTLSVSPLMYFKGIRELTIGATLLTLQAQCNQDGVTTFAVIVAVARLGDGVIVWLHGGDSLRFKAFGHWLTSIGFVGWVLWRWTR